MWRKRQHSEVYWPSWLKAWPFEPNLLGVASSFGPPSSVTGKTTFTCPFYDTVFLTIEYLLFGSAYEEERSNTCDSL